MIGESLKGLQDSDVEVFKGTIYQRWQSIVSIRQHFWNRWRDEYLVSLQRRSKWIRSTQKDYIVIIYEGNILGSFRDFGVRDLLLQLNSWLFLCLPCLGSDGKLVYMKHSMISFVTIDTIKFACAIFE